jgi:hypothetical protein
MQKLMTADEVDNELESDLEDESESECNNEDPQSSKKRGRQLGEKYVQRMAVLTLNDCMQIRILDKEKSMWLERKSKNDNTNNWTDRGYFSDLERLLKDVYTTCAKEKIYTKETRDYKELIGILKESNKDIKMYSEKIITAIKNNDYLKEIRGL